MMPENREAARSLRAASTLSTQEPPQETGRVNGKESRHQLLLLSGKAHLSCFVSLQSWVLGIHNSRNITGYWPVWGHSLCRPGPFLREPATEAED